LSTDTRNSTASAHALGTVIILVIVFVVAALLLLLFPGIPGFYDGSVPSPIKITKIRHVNEKGVLNYDSYLVLKNTGTIGYSNANIYAQTYRNGELLACSIKTMNGHNYISTHHYHIQNMGGQGSCGATWDPGEMVSIDYADRTFHPGDEVTFEVYDAVTGQIISRHTVTA
jgi:hypothetical protein